MPATPYNDDVWHVAPWFECLPLDRSKWARVGIIGVTHLAGVTVGVLVGGGRISEADLLCVPANSTRLYAMSSSGRACGEGREAVMLALDETRGLDTMLCRIRAPGVPRARTLARTSSPAPGTRRPRAARYRFTLTV